MLIEIPLTFAAGGLSAAILIPAYNAMLGDPTFTPGVAIAVASAIGGFGTFGGANLGLSHAKPIACIGWLIAWGGVALALSWMAGSCALQATEAPTKLFYLAAAALPVILYLFALLTGWKDRYSKEE